MNKVVLILLILFVAGFLFTEYKTNKPYVRPTETQLEMKSTSSPITKTIQVMVITPEAFTGQYFKNYCMSGEIGHLEADGVVQLTIGRDFVQNDTRPTEGKGKWRLDGGELILSETSISDGTYTFLPKIVGDQTVLAADEEGCSIVVGKDIETIDKYIDSLP
jgi:hypothetical protein